MLAAVGGAVTSFVRRPGGLVAVTPSVRPGEGDEGPFVRVARLREWRGRWAVQDSVRLRFPGQSRLTLSWRETRFDAALPTSADRRRTRVPGTPLTYLTERSAGDVLNVRLSGGTPAVVWTARRSRPRDGPARTILLGASRWPPGIVVVPDWSAGEPPPEAVAESLILMRFDDEGDPAEAFTVEDWQRAYAESVERAGEALASRDYIGPASAETAVRELVALGVRVPMPAARAALAGLVEPLSLEAPRDDWILERLGFARLLAGDAAVLPEVAAALRWGGRGLPPDLVAAPKRMAYLARLLVAVDDPAVRDLAVEHLLTWGLAADVFQRLADAQEDGLVDLPPELAERVQAMAPWNRAWSVGPLTQRGIRRGVVSALVALLLAVCGVLWRVRKPSRGVWMAFVAVLIGLIVAVVPFVDAGWDAALHTGGLMVAAIGAERLARAAGGSMARVGPWSLLVAGMAHAVYVFGGGEVALRVSDAAAAFGLVGVASLAAPLVAPLRPSTGGPPRRPATSSKWRLGLPFAPLAALGGLVPAAVAVSRLRAGAFNEVQLGLVALLLTTLAVTMASLVVWRQALRDGSRVRLFPAPLLVGLAAPLAFLNAAALTQLFRGLDGSAPSSFAESTVTWLLFIPAFGALFRLHDAARVRARIEVARAGEAGA